MSASTPPTVEASATKTEEIELPAPADLLNQLKAKRKRSKAELADVEAILEMLPSLPASPSLDRTEIEEWQKFWEAEGLTPTQIQAVAEAHQRLQEIEKKLGWRR